MTFSIFGAENSQVSNVKGAVKSKNHHYAYPILIMIVAGAHCSRNIHDTYKPWLESAWI